MIPPRRYFPWKIARQIFFANLVVLGLVLLMIGLSLRIQVYQTMAAGVDVHDALSGFDSFLTSVLTTVFVLGALMLAFNASRYARPLGKLIQRARELRRLDAKVGESEDDDGDERLDDINDEPGEWFDLERALNRIHKDLRAKTEALGREREELSALIGAVSDAILAVDKAERPLFFNSTFALTFRGAQRIPQALSLGEVFRAPEVLAGYRDVLKSGESRALTATLHTAHSPLPRHFSVSIAPLGDRQSVEGAIGIFHDVTELKQSEQIRIEFVGNASHELRTPLTTIKGYVDTLRDDVKAQRYDGAPQFIDVISRNVDRLIFLVNDLLDLSTLESGAELAKTPISTVEVTEPALRQVDAKRLAKRQEVVAHYETDHVRADARRVEQVIVNLVHNAIKYTPEGSRIEVIWARAEGGTILRVKDNGPGISFEHQSRLFERFYRVDAGRSRDQGGTGLGLSIVKHIMLKHGGSVRVQSRLGEGAEFVCFFPEA